MAPATSTASKSLGSRNQTSRTSKTSNSHSADSGSNPQEQQPPKLNGIQIGRKGFSHRLPYSELKARSRMGSITELLSLKSTNCWNKENANASPRLIPTTAQIPIPHLQF